MNYNISHQTKDTLIEEYIHRVKALTKRVEELENHIKNNNINYL